jgi:hypothetical protein
MRPAAALLIGFGLAVGGLPRPFRATQQEEILNHAA